MYGRDGGEAGVMWEPGCDCKEEEMEGGEEVAAAAAAEDLFVSSVFVSRSAFCRVSAGRLLSSLPSVPCAASAAQQMANRLINFNKSNIN